MDICKWWAWEVFEWPNIKRYLPEKLTDWMWFHWGFIFSSNFYSYEPTAVSLRYAVVTDSYYSCKICVIGDRRRLFQVLTSFFNCCRTLFIPLPFIHTSVYSLNLLTLYVFSVAFPSCHVECSEIPLNIRLFSVTLAIFVSSYSIRFFSQKILGSTDYSFAFQK